MQRILLTGGAGYIGSHTLIEIIKAGFVPVVLDNLFNSSAIAITQVGKIVGADEHFLDKVFVKGDVRDDKLLKELFDKHKFCAVIHFAGLKAVGESVAKPLDYYDNNVAGTLTLLSVMAKFNVKNLIFSSSATVYGTPKTLPITEDMPRVATNPYGQSKIMVEHILQDLAVSDNDWQVVSLRYFNPIGADKSGHIGEDPSDVPNNLMPYISQVAAGKLPKLSVFGDDYDTSDGTGVRDYIHVVDLAKGHKKSVDYLLANKKLGFVPINLGTGKGTSVLQLIHSFEQATGQVVPYQIVQRRKGDVAQCYASCDKAKTLLGWQAMYDIQRMCTDTWRWQSQNANGYLAQS